MQRWAKPRGWRVHAEAAAQGRAGGAVASVALLFRSRYGIRRLSGAARRPEVAGRFIAVVARHSSEARGR
eukprot:524597-Alexandrium_andersonii.AAC.1